MPRGASFRYRLRGLCLVSLPQRVGRGGVGEGSLSSKFFVFGGEPQRSLGPAILGREPVPDPLTSVSSTFYF